MYNFTREDIDLEAIRALARAAALGFKARFKPSIPPIAGSSRQ
jgi:hypothetical protein